MDATNEVIAKKSYTSQRSNIQYALPIIYLNVKISIYPEIANSYDFRILGL